MVYPSRREVGIDTGLKIAPLPAAEIPAIAIAKFQPAGDGTYRPLLVPLDTNIRVTEAAKILDVPYRTLLRLVRAGFIRGLQPAPGLLQMSLHSWFDHVRMVDDDPAFWLQKENHRRYQQAL